MQPSGREPIFAQSAQEKCPLPSAMPLLTFIVLDLVTTNLRYENRVVYRRARAHSAPTEPNRQQSPARRAALGLLLTCW